MGFIAGRGWAGCGCAGDGAGTRSKATTPRQVRRDMNKNVAERIS